MENSEHIRTPPAYETLKESIECGTGMEYEDTDPAISTKEHKLGLGFDAPKSVWKLQRIIDGHPCFFGALAELLNAGNELLVIKGNHDAELSFVEVRDSFHFVRREVHRAPCQKGRGVRGRGEVTVNYYQVATSRSDSARSPNALAAAGAATVLRRAVIIRKRLK